MHLAPDSDRKIVTKGLQRLFSEYIDRPFVFVEPGGNAGDTLIYKGADKLARHIGLDVVSVKHDEFMRSKYDPDVVIYIHGGGAYNPIWVGRPMIALQKAVEHKGVVIQGPQTYWNDNDFLKVQVAEPVGRAKSKRLVFFSREKVSGEALKRILPQEVESIVDHDSALNLDRVDLESLLPKHRSDVYTLYAIREDKEARNPGGIGYFSVWSDPVRPRQRFEDWLLIHLEAKEIITNRLHSSICGSILGVPTTLLPNSYFKNRAVWEHSLAERGVVWSDRTVVSSASKAVHHIGVLRSVLQKRPVRKVIHRLHGLK